jgi:hypothetical protein
MIPEELHDVKQWTYSYSPTELKRPTHTDYEKNGALSYQKASSLARSKQVLLGMFVTPDDPYILGDIDHIENVKEPFGELPMPLTDLLINNPTYVEVSPSGKGLRFIYKLNNESGKSDLDGKVFLLKSFNQNAREAEIHIGPPWMTITGNATPFSKDEICEISVPILEDVFNLRRYEKRVADKLPEKDAPPLEEIRHALLRVGLDRNPRVVRAYSQVFNENYHHYTFWMKMMMALHNYSEIAKKPVESFHLFNEWSQSDPKYVDEQDCYKHWQSLAGKQTEISYKTIFKIFYQVHPPWPRPKPRTKLEIKNHLPPKPLNTEYRNFETVLNKYAIQIYHSTGLTSELYVTGDMDVMDKYFSSVYELKKLYGKFWGPISADTLTTVLLQLCQDEGYYGLSLAQLKPQVATAVVTANRSIDIFRYYFSRPHHYFRDVCDDNLANYERSHFDDIVDCFHFKYLTEDTEREKRLYVRYLECWFMGMIRYSFFPETFIHTNNCILILSGKEQTRKTSFFRQILPPFMREHFIRITTHGLNTENDIRDIQKLSASAKVIVFDEVDAIIKDDVTESRLKKLVDNTPSSFIDKYQVLPSHIYPQAMYGGTTNKRTLAIGDDGSRRFFFIPVSWVEVENLAFICWHRVFNDLRKKISMGLKSAKDKVPWLLTPRELQYQAELHRLIRSSTNLDMLLHDIWMFDSLLDLSTKVLPGCKSLQTDKSGRLLTTSQIQNIVSNAAMMSIKTTALIHSLERKCGYYTSTQLDSTSLVTPSCTVYKGQASQGPHNRWIMPPIREKWQHLIAIV